MIERARSAEIAACVLQKKDLGCKKAEAVETVEEEKLGHCSRENRRFWRCLTDRETTGTVAEAGPAEEDEVLYCTALFCILLYCTAIYCIVL